MKYLVIVNPILLSFIINTDAFQPALTRTSLVQVAAKTVDVDFFNPAREIDMGHAHDCAENFGKCSIEDLEEMRTALHTERLQHQTTDFQSPDLAVEIDHRLLEEDLNFQLALLKDEMHTLPQWSSPHFIQDGKPAFSPPPVMMDGTGTGTDTDTDTDNVAVTSDTNPGKSAVVSPAQVMTMDSSGNAAVAQPKHHDSDMNSFIQRGEEMFLIPNGLSDVAAFGAALLIISLTPLLFNN